MLKRRDLLTQYDQPDAKSFHFLRKVLLQVRAPQPRSPRTEPFMRWLVVTTSAFGLAYNTQFVRDQLFTNIVCFKDGGNPLGIKVAAIQADIVAHSMGGLIARSVAADSDFLNDDTFRQGAIHKLITLDTPHLGTPLAAELLQSSNDCVRNLLAASGKVALQKVTTPGGTFDGGVFDLEPMNQLRQTGTHPLATAFVAGVTTQSNLNGLGTSRAAFWIHDLRCFSNPLAMSLTPTTWDDDVFSGQPNDAIVPLQSQFNGASGFEFSHFVHSQGAEALGFTGPSVLVESQPDIPAFVIGLLNTAVARFQALNP